MAWEKRVVHVTGGPVSGKTILATLLYDFFDRKNFPAVFIRVWPRNSRAITVLNQAASKEGYSPEEIVNGLVFIIDEGQSTYFDQEFWLDILKTQAHVGSGPRFCIFSSYGHPATGFSCYPTGSPPAIIPPTQRVSLYRSNIPGSPCISLCFSRGEFKGAIRRLNALTNKAVPLTKDAKEYILELTQGHPAAVRGIVDLLQFASVPPCLALSCHCTLALALTPGKALLPPDQA